jgi:hypothetical protein
MRRFFRLILLGCWGTTPAAADPLLDASRAKQTLHTSRLIASGADVQQRGPHGDTALHWAAYHGRESLVAQLIARGADVDATVDNGNTPLHQAAYRGHTGIVELLIAQGAELNRRTRSGVTPLGWAKRNGHHAVAQLLIAHGAQDGAAPARNDTLARRQTDDASPRNDALPDAVLFAALSYLPSSLKGTSVSAPDTAEAGSPIASPTEPPRRLAGFRIQLAAMRSEARAHEMWQQYLARHPAILSSLQLSVEPAHVNGVSFYRIQAGPLTEVTARSVCDELTRDKQACMVVGVSAMAGL